MAKLSFYKVNALPGSPVADAVYFVANSGIAETYVTDSSGTAKQVGNSAMIEAKIAAALADHDETVVVADITARDALSPAKNLTVWVLDASDDGTVTSGAALYLYQETGDTWHKLAEAEAMDISGHSHSNLTQLDKVGEDGDGDLTYDSEPVVRFETADW